MTKAAIRFQLSGVDQAIEALAGVNKDSAFAIRTAMRATRTKAAQLTRQKLAGRWGIPQKPLRKRVQAYFHPRGDGKVLRLWLGLKKKPRAAEGRKVADALESIGDRRRAMLPIEQGADQILIQSARSAMTERYGPVLRREFKRRLLKRSNRARRRG